jgi:HPt (histidine-containing phosphotransfer) domain-containing protein
MVVLNREESLHNDLLSRCGGDTTLLGELVELFNQDCPGRLNQIREAISQCDPSRLRHAAHLLRGSASSFGMSNAYEAAGRLELMALTGDLLGAERACATLETAIRELQDHLADALKQLNA